ncbi:MAG: class SAM-dependent methyltransferase, partial [Alphaproteobacteria bacterium]|nr:class SAM-dependent methyltransferase [Alphaproteobacteria bacterium]
MRVLVPEILDHLPADDPRAMRSRRDLARINAVMRQSVIMARALARCQPPRVIADLGSGDGRFMLRVAKSLSKHWPGVQLLICDQQNIVAAQTHAAFEKLGWGCEVRQGDIFQTLPQADIITANLFLHHFEDAQLAPLLALAASRAKAFVTCEPRRSRLALLGAHMVWALGANDVTRHDAVASVRAGFTDLELASLWPQGNWTLDEHAVFPFTHVFS